MIDSDEGATARWTTVQKVLDWERATQHLTSCRAAYTAIGQAGQLALLISIEPLERRLFGGERTPALYDAILAIAL